MHAGPRQPQCLVFSEWKRLRRRISYSCTPPTRGVLCSHLHKGGKRTCGISRSHDAARGLCMDGPGQCSRHGHQRRGGGRGRRRGGHAGVRDPGAVTRSGGADGALPGRLQEVHARPNSPGDAGGGRHGHTRQHPRAQGRRARGCGDAGPARGARGRRQAQLRQGAAPGAGRGGPPARDGQPPHHHEHLQAPAQGRHGRQAPPGAALLRDAALPRDPRAVRGSVPAPHVGGPQGPRLRALHRPPPRRRGGPRGRLLVGRHGRLPHRRGAPCRQARRQAGAVQPQPPQPLRRHQAPQARHPRQARGQAEHGACHHLLPHQPRLRQPGAPPQRAGRRPRLRRQGREGPREPLLVRGAGVVEDHGTAPRQPAALQGRRRALPHLHRSRGARHRRGGAALRGQRDAARQARGLHPPHRPRGARGPDGPGHLAGGHVQGARVVLPEVHQGPRPWRQGAAV
mmetsp:Transcript_70761/g.188899  ORF Transcript_70761/g.188899 Transcript_70761/m.188899 type:complete len:455 (+) Transcript_70761:580-1944(+)